MREEAFRAFCVWIIVVITVCVTSITVIALYPERSFFPSACVELVRIVDSHSPMFECPPAARLNFTYFPDSSRVITSCQCGKASR